MCDVPPPSICFWHERAGNDIVATIVIHIFPFFFSSVVTFSHWRSAWIKKLILALAYGVPAIGVRAVDCWQWRSGHYFHPSFLSPPFSPFFSVVTFSHRRSARIKKLISQKLTGTPKNLGVDRPPLPFLGPLAAILDFAGGAVLQAPFAARLVFSVSATSVMRVWHCPPPLMWWCNIWMLPK